MAKAYYSNPLLDELYSRIPEDRRRMTDHSFAIAAHISEILARKGWTKSDLANAMGKKNAEISRWMSGQHNFTLDTIAKIEAVLGEDIIAVKKYRKPVTGYNKATEQQRRYLSDSKADDN